MASSRKVFVLGLDAAPYSTIAELAARGEMPNIAKVIGEGVFGSLDSTIPPISPVAWSSMVTGMGPGKHGVFNFGQVTAEGRFAPFTSSSIRGKAIWDVSGKRSLLLHVPMTWPPYPVNGLMVSGFPSPSSRPETYPADLLSRIDAMAGGYVVEDPDTDKRGSDGLHEPEFVERLTRTTEMKFRVAVRLIREEQWEFAMLVVTELDRIQHVLFRQFAESRSSGPNQGSRLLMEYYRFLDDAVGRLTEALPEETILFVVSDHGCEPLYKRVGLNNALVEFGYLSESTTAKAVQRYRESGRLQRAARRLLPDSTLGRLGRIADKRSGVLDSKAMSHQIGEITLNSGWSEEVRKAEALHLVSLLEDLKDDGQKVVDKAFAGRELYQGPHVGEAPDVVVVPNSGYEMVRWTKSLVESVTPAPPGLTARTAGHSSNTAKEGIIIVHGRGIKRGARVNAGICDVAPTVLRILRSSIPEASDGNVLSEIFEEGQGFEELEERAVASGGQQAVDGRVEEADEQLIEERLRKLGYV